MITKIEMQNFQPFYGEHSVQLQPGVTLIEAAYDDNPTASNRGGKSALLESIAFTMYDYTRTLKKDLIHYDAEKKCRVTVDTDCCGTFSRVWTGNSFKAFATHNVPMSAEVAFATWFMHGDDTTNLFAMDATQRKKILVPVLVSDLDLWASLESRAESKYVSARNTINTAQRAVTDISAKLEELRRTPPDQDLINQLPMLTNECNAVKDQQNQLVLSNRHAMEQRSVLTSSIERLKQVQNILSTMQIDESVQVDKLQAYVLQLEQTLQTYKVERSRLEQKKHEAMAAVLSYERAYKNLETEQVMCPITKQACGTATDYLHVLRNQAHTDLAQAKQVQQTAQAEYDTFIELYTKLEEKYHKRSQKLQSVQQNTSLRNEMIHTWHRICELHADMLHESGTQDVPLEDVIRLLEYAKLEHTQTCDAFAFQNEQLNKTIIALTQQLTAAHAEQAAKETYDIRMRELTEELNAAEAHLLDVQRDVKVWSHLTKAFGPGGIPADKAACGAATLENFINDTLLKINTPMRIRVEPFESSASTYEPVCSSCGFTLERSSKRSTCPNCSEPRTLLRHMNFALKYERGTGYRIESKGGQLMSDLACRVGLYRLHATLTGCSWDTFIADEIFGNLDEPNRDEVYRFLSETLLSPMFGFRQVLMVSHIPLELSGMENRIMVRAMKSATGSVHSRIE